MHLAARDREVDPVIRPDRAEALVDAAALHGGYRLANLCHGSAGRIHIDAAVELAAGELGPAGRIDKGGR